MPPGQPVPALALPSCKLWAAAEALCPAEAHAAAALQLVSLPVQVLSSRAVPNLHGDTQGTSEHSSIHCRRLPFFPKLTWLVAKSSCVCRWGRRRPLLGMSLQEPRIRLRLDSSPAAERASGELPPGASSLSMAELGPSALPGSLPRAAGFVPAPPASQYVPAFLVSPQPPLLRSGTVGTPALLHMVTPLAAHPSTARDG